MMVPLASLATCFQGLRPAQLYTCSSDGIPNAAYLSHVEYVDAEHVALSFQFFNKSRRNIAENPHALVNMVDPDTGQGWSLRLEYVRSETTGPLFERMALRIETIASYCNLKGVFKLRASDIYRVVDVARIPEESGSPTAGVSQMTTTLDPVFTMKALHDLSARINRADSLETLVDSILAGIEESFGFTQSMMLLPTEQEGVLVTVASRGYPAKGVGSEQRYGEGIAGAVAESRAPIRISGLMRGMLYAMAMYKASLNPDPQRDARRVPVPGLANPDSQLGVPLIVRGELVGVLVIESETPYRFHEEDKANIELLGSYLAIAIQNMQWQERSAASAPDTLAPAPVDVAVPLAQAVGQARAAVSHQVTYYASDECILLDGDYLIRGLPAKILWRLLNIRDKTGRDEFTNRELRLDKSLNLPEWKDNLESRLLLLRRRLEEKCPEIRLAPRSRGRFALDVQCLLILNEQL